MYRSCSDCGCSLDPQERCDCGGTDASYTRGEYYHSPGRKNIKKKPHHAPTIPLSPEERQAGLVIANEIMERIQKQKMAELAERLGVRI